MNFSRLIAQFQWIQIIADAMDLNRNTFYKSSVLPWAQEWLLLMPTCSWSILEKKTYIYKGNSTPRIWFRLIDDIWGILSGNLIEFQTFVEYISSVHKSIKIY